LPDTTGNDILKKIKTFPVAHSILLITGYGSIEDAVDAMKMGADDYLTKPLDLFKLRHQVEVLSNKQKLIEEVDQLKQRLDKRYGLESIVGNSSEMEKVYDQVRLVAPTNSTVLITGDSGTGKELIANAIHQLSPRKGQRFLPVNCAAIASNLLESELFGHEKGSFTGAANRRLGKFELANKGTFFLDEISEINPDVQVKLLRVLEQREIMRVGGDELINVDVRVIAATNKNLKKLVDEGKFREDLYYRLKVVTISLPSLAKRKEDIPLLVNSFLKHFCELHGKELKHITPDVMTLLTNHTWQGNVRELKNLIESLVVLTLDNEIKMEHLSDEYKIKVDTKGVGTEFANLSMSEIEKLAIYKALEKTDGNRTQAAKLLGIGLRTLQRKLKEYEENSSES
jgi:DNA-binding NtrC family response regulator